MDPTYYKLERLAVVANDAAFSLDPQVQRTGEEAVAQLNTILGPKGVFCEINKMGLCLRIGKAIPDLEHFPGTCVVPQVASYIEQELPDGSGFKILKSRFSCDKNNVLYKSSLG